MRRPTMEEAIAAAQAVYVRQWLDEHSDLLAADLGVAA